jgi:hypothetical protein
MKQLLKLLKTLTDLSIATEAFYAESQKITPDSSQPASGNDNIVKLEKIMIDTSNNVLETKRRFEYGIHQIILEVGDVMKTANSSM